MKNILIITGQSSYPIIEKVISPIKNHKIKVYKAPITISAFISETLVMDIIKEINIQEFDLILLPGFIQWDTTKLEELNSIAIRKGPEFASDLPMVLKHIDTLKLSNSTPANKILELSSEQEYEEILKEQLEVARDNIDSNTFFLNEDTSNLMIGPNLPPPIIAEIVNCPEKNNHAILRKVKHYIESGADIIDIGCVTNKSYPDRIKEIVHLIRNNFNVLISIDSMDNSEILTAVDEGVDLILSLDRGNYKDFLNLPRDIPIVILPTDIKAAYFPKEPEIRVKNLLKLTQELKQNGFKKLIADPLLETPITPGICNSLEAYFLYKKQVAKEINKNLEIPLFFGISNVVELMDIDSVGINGLLASIAVELDMGILFTVEHSTKLIEGVRELKESVKLNYVSKYKKTPPINHGINVFRAKGKTSQALPEIDTSDIITVKEYALGYITDKNGYFKFYVNHYTKEIYVLFFSNEDFLLKTLVGTNAEALSKKVLELNLTTNLQHISYIGRELAKAEVCLNIGKPFIQDE
ncbi:MAG TPA: dihydropteroate synthase-like protein [Candidatus Nanopelagicaceae bacterium]|nr:dihydropteroate synthase-like protein [Candidatus Nanopelagicaceae bacterium]